MKIDYLRRLTLVLGGLGLAGSLVVTMATVANDQIPVVSGEQIPHNPFEQRREKPIVRQDQPPRVVVASSESTVGGSFRPITQASIQPAVPRRVTRLPAVSSSPEVVASSRSSSSPSSIKPIATANLSLQSINPARGTDSSKPATEIGSRESLASSSPHVPVEVVSSPATVRPAPRLERLPATVASRSNKPSRATSAGHTESASSSLPTVMPVAADSSQWTAFPQPVVVASEFGTTSDTSTTTSGANSPSRQVSITAAQPTIASVTRSTTPRNEVAPTQPSSGASRSSDRTASLERIPVVPSSVETEPTRDSVAAMQVARPSQPAPAIKPESTMPAPATFASTASAPRIEPTRPTVAPRIDETATTSPVSIRMASSSNAEAIGTAARAIPAVVPAGGTDREIWQETEDLVVPDGEMIEGEEILDGEITSVIDDYGFGSDCCQPCPRRRYAIAEAMLFRREGEFTQLSTAFAADGFDYELGGRATFGVRADCLKGWEASYMTTEPWFTQSSQLGGSLFPNFTAGGGLVSANLSSFTNADFQETVYKSHLQSFEFNRLDWGWDVISVGLGLRYMTLEDDLRFTSIKGADRGDLLIETNNHIFGPQWTGELFYDIGNRTFLSCKGKIGVFANINDGEATFVNQGPGAIAFTGTDQNLGFAAEGELQANVYYKLTRNTRLRAGYEMWYLYGAATANDQLTSVITPDLGRSIDDGDDIFMHGAAVGFEWIR